MSKPGKHYGKWRIRWVDPFGARRSEVYQSHDDAVFVLRKKELEVDEIRRGLKMPISSKRTFGELADYWLSKRAIQKRSLKDDESIIRCHLRPSFGHLCVTDIGITQIDEFILSRNHLDKKTVSNHLTLLISMFNLAVDLNWVAKTPPVKKPKVRFFSSDYRYLKTVDEISRFLRAAGSLGEDIFTLYATAIHTGMRAGELAALEKTDINFDKRLIIVQRSFGGPTKAEDVRYVPILDSLLPLLRSWVLKSPSQILFPSEAGKMYGESARVFQETLHRTLEIGNFPKVRIKEKECRYVRFHDLRHTFASHWVMNGGDLFKLQKILGHKSIQMTQRYAHLTPDAFSGDYSRMGTAISISPAVIVPIFRASLAT